MNWLKTNKVLLAIPLALIIGGAVGRYTAPDKIKVVEKTVADNRVAQSADSQKASVQATTSAQVAVKNTVAKDHRTYHKHVETKPDGTKVEDVVVSNDSDTKTGTDKVQVSGSTNSELDTSKSASSSDQHTETSKQIERIVEHSRFNVSVLLGTSLSQVSFKDIVVPQIGGPLSWGISANMNVFGPITAGAVVIPTGPQKSAYVSLGFNFK